jgi:hypothetical protein
MLIGFSAVIGQIVLMRELMADYNGCESSLGVALAAWLFWTAVGSFLASAFALGQRHPRRWVAAFECLLGLSLPLAIWGLRESKSLFQTVPGELVGPLPVLLASLICLSLFCVIAGALFVAAARMMSSKSAVDARRASKHGLPAGSGRLRRWRNHCQPGPAALSFALSDCRDHRARNESADGQPFLWLRMSRKQIAQQRSAAATLLAVFLLIAKLRRASRSNRRRSLWRGFHLLASRDSIYGNLTVIETGDNAQPLRKRPASWPTRRTKAPPKNRFTTRCWSIPRRSEFCSSAAAQMAASRRRSSIPPLSASIWSSWTPRSSAWRAIFFPRTPRLRSARASALRRWPRLSQRDARQLRCNHCQPS